MDADKLEEVNRLTRYREKAVEIRNAANDGQNDVRCRVGGIAGGHDVVTDVCGEAYMRQVVIEACTRQIIVCEEKLKSLGVSISHPEPVFVGTAEEWKAEAGMYQRAWSRELGPRKPKRHLIDELVLGTQKLRIRANLMLPEDSAHEAAITKEP